MTAAAPPHVRRISEAPAELRLRSVASTLVSLPWQEPLGEWDPTEVPFRDVPVGPSRHLVRFVHVEGTLWALKELPRRIAEKEYTALRVMESLGLPTVHAAGTADTPGTDNAVLVTQYLAGSWQYRRLLMRIPLSQREHRHRLLAAMASLLVELHRNGVYWGDCSLANTLFKRDGQVLQAYLVDAETAATHETLSDGQREGDLEILTENVAGGLLDLAVRLEQPEEVLGELIEEAHLVRQQYGRLWDALHRQSTFRFDERQQVQAQIRDLNRLGFAVDEIRLTSVGPGAEDVRLKVVVAGRRFHADELHRITGLDVGEGQATLLLNDLRGYALHLERLAGGPVAEPVAATRWLREVFEPGVARAQEALGVGKDPVQAYCDLLEVRWIMSEDAGHDVGDDPALSALATGSTPEGSAAQASVVDAPTERLPLPTREQLIAAGWDDVSPPDR